MRKIILILLIAFLFLKTFSQDHQRVNLNNEQLIVHLDRSEYVAGERVWFKIIAYQEEETEVLKTSKLVYLEIINPQGLAIARKKVRLNGEYGFGEFQLPDTITTGVYRVIAYTNWMKNMGYSSFFKSNIVVYNPQKKGVVKNVEVLSDFQFSTENNEIVADLNNTIYYKLNSNFLDSCSIVIKDSEKNIVKSKEIENAYGYISFIPKKDIKYFVSLIRNNNLIIEKEFPIAKTEGLIINLKEVNAENVIFQVQSTELYRSLIKEITYKINYSEILNKLDLNTNSIITINKALLKNGKNKITFYKNDKSLISERYFYFEGEKKQILKLDGIEENPIRKRMLAKAKVGTIINSDFNNVNLSVSVHKIPGNIDTKNVFYQGEVGLNSSFVDVNILNIIQLFKQHSAVNSGNKFYPEYKGALLTGRIITQEGNPLSENDIFLSFPDSVIRLSITKTNKKGEFAFYIKSDELERDIVINSNNNNKNLTILIDDNFYNNYPTQKISLNLVYEEYLNELYVNYRINKLYEIENSKNNEDTVLINNRHSFYEKVDEVYKLDDYVKLDSIHEYFYEIVQGVRVTKNKRNWIARVVDAGTGISYNSDPALFIDGVYFENIKSLLKLDPSECSAIEVIRKPIMLKNRNYDGLIAIFTKDYNLNGIDLPSNSTRIEYKISDKSFEFWSKPIIKKEMPDFRNTLYWNPEIVLEKGEETEIEFYTGDDSSWYEIEIKGITDTGIEVSEHKIFKVGNP